MEDARKPPVTRETALPAPMARRAKCRVRCASPPPWLLKVLGVAAEKRLKNYSAAEIDE